MRFKFVLLILSLAVFSACSFINTLPEEERRQPDLDLLLSWMSGSFSREEQARTDPEFFHICLEMAQVWEARKGAYIFKKLEDY